MYGGGVPNYLSMYVHSSNPPLISLFFTYVHRTYITSRGWGMGKYFVHYHVEGKNKSKSHKLKCICL